jgi:hypothetical protein
VNSTRPYAPADPHSAGALSEGCTASQSAEPRAVISDVTTPSADRSATSGDLRMSTGEEETQVKLVNSVSLLNELKSVKMALHSNLI